jgi:hypothetical protein
MTVVGKNSRIPWVDVDSSAISAVAWLPDHQNKKYVGDLYVQFHEGDDHYWVYHRVPIEVYVTWIERALSAGKYWHQFVKDKFEVDRVPLDID